MCIHRCVLKSVIWPYYMIWEYWKIGLLYFYVKLFFLSFWTSSESGIKSERFFCVNGATSWFGPKVEFSIEFTGIIPVSCMSFENFTADYFTYYSQENLLDDGIDSSCVASSCSKVTCTWHCASWRNIIDGNKVSNSVSNYFWYCTADTTHNNDNEHRK